MCRAGKGEADSSEGEDEEDAGQQPNQLVNTLLDAEDGNVQIDQQGHVVQPSLAFCQALDHEQEYDEVDAVAGRSLRGVMDPADIKPNRFTEVCVDRMLLCSTSKATVHFAQKLQLKSRHLQLQYTTSYRVIAAHEGCFIQVLDDNVFEQRMKSHESASPSTAAPMDVDTLPSAQRPNRQVTLNR